MKSIVLIGAGGHCRACIDVIKSTGCHNIAGVIDKQLFSGRDAFSGYPVLGIDSDLSEVLKRFDQGFVAVGQITDPSLRVRLFNLLVSSGTDIPSIQSSHSYVSGETQVGKGSIIMHGCVLNSYAKIGRNCIINSRALIEHDVVIGDHCHVSTGALVNGGVKVGERVFIGSGAIIANGINIGSDVVIGAGVVVKHNLESGVRLSK